MALTAARSAPGAIRSRLLSGSRIHRLRSRRARKAAWCALAAVLGLLFSSAAARAQTDTRPPELFSVASISDDGRTLSLAFDEPLDLNSVPASSAFKVMFDGVNTNVTGVNLAVPRVTGTVTLTLSPARPSFRWFRVTYTPPATNRLQDEAGNAVESFSETFALPGSKPPSDPSPPTALFPPPPCCGPPRFPSRRST